MAEFGSHPGSFSNWEFTGLNTDNMIAQALATAPELLDVTSISCFFGGNGATVAAKLAIWNSSGTLLAATPQFTAPSGSQSVGGQSWQTQSLSSPLRLSAGQQVFIGWWRAPSGSAVWSYTASGDHKHKTDTSGNVGSLAGNTDHAVGNIGAFATYTPVSLGKVWVSTPSNRSWTRPTVIRADSAATTKVFISTPSNRSWVQL
jgi:hypothetical protein